MPGTILAVTWRDGEHEEMPYLEHGRAVGRFRLASHLLTWISGRGNWWEASPAPAA